jgi:asparagine synthase (glutamine-hydrolysing)
MLTDDRNLILVFNGEIYNYVELREELQSLGYTFKSTGDTEVLLHAYREWGRDCLERLNGMWAFLIYDKRRGVLFGSRDRFGKKPFYYYRSHPYFFVGSEIKAILASGRYRGGVHWKSARAFLLSSSFDQVAEDNQTFYTGIEQFPAGTAFEIDLGGRIRTWSYWSIEETTELRKEIQNPDKVWAEVFEDSVRLRLRSDVPVGIFLSGGLDSTSIMCTLCRLREKQNNGANDNLLAFSFQSTEHDESRYIRDTVKQTGVELVPFQPDPRGLLEKLHRILWYQDEPVHSMAALITFELSRLAAERGVKVILNGGGPDEYLAGYPNFFSNYWHTLLEERGAWEAQREIESYCDRRGGNPQALLRKARQLRLRVKLSRMSWYRKLASRKRCWQLRKHPWFTRALLDQVATEDPGFVSYELDSMLRRSVKLAPLPLYLRIEDRNSMAHSIEARMPFLDYRLVSLAFQLPAHWKMRGPWNKFIMREAMRQRIPESVRTRMDKMGFPVPTKTWFADILFPPMLDTVNSQEFRERGIYKVDVIKRDMEAHRRGKIDISSELFGLMQFEMWSKLFDENTIKVSKR